MSKIVTAEDNFIGLIHDNKLWGMKFNFDGSQTSVKPHLVLDVDYEKGSDYFELENKVVFYVCPANLIFNGVSSFNMNLSSDVEELNHYKADCLYISNIEKKEVENNRFFFKIIFCDDAGFIEFYTDSVSLLIDENKPYEVDGNCAIPIKLRNNIKGVVEG